MTLWEMTRRIAGDDYRFDGSDAEVNGLCAELKDERVLFIVVRTETPDGRPHEIIRLVPVPLKPEERVHSPCSASSIGPCPTIAIT
jgi:hypothetical protein